MEQGHKTRNWSNSH